METVVEPTTEMSMKLKQKQEALARLMHLKVPARICRDFERFGRVRLCVSPLGTYCELDKTIQDAVKQFEEKYEATVYMVVRLHTSAGLLDSLLYVGRYEEEWKEEKLDIRDGYIMTYTINWDHDFCSEFGSICYARNDFGGIIRLN